MRYEYTLEFGSQGAFTMSHLRDQQGSRLKWYLLLGIAESLHQKAKSKKCKHVPYLAYQVP